jgi:hypothetical protein
MREAALGPFVGGSMDQDAGFAAPDSGAQQVLFAQAVQDQAVSGGAHVYTVMAATSRLGLVDLAVTVRRNSAGQLQLVGEPAFVGAPSTAPAVDDPSQQGELVSDPQLAAVVTRAIGNYLAGASSELQADLDPGAVVSLPQTTFHVQQVTRVAWLQPGQVAAVDVQAADRFGASYDLHYVLSVTHRDRWYVTSIETNPTLSGGE